MCVSAPAGAFSDPEIATLYFSAQKIAVFVFLRQNLETSSIWKQRRGGTGARWPPVGSAGQIVKILGTLKYQNRQNPYR